MDINKPFSYKELKEAIDKLRPKEEVHVNQQTYNAIIERLDFEPKNLIVNNYIPLDQAIIINIEEIQKELFKPIII